MTENLAVQQAGGQEILELSQEIICCRKCPRLVKFREHVSKVRTKRFKDFDYWGRPIPGFGDDNARLIVVGLAPAAQGGNRTGRVFTGDSSAKFLVKHLYEAGFASQPTSETRDDGLRYIDCFVTAVVRCVPPENKPTTSEIDNCAPYFERDMLLHSNSRAVLALGRIAFDAVIDFAKKYRGVKETYRFVHGQKYRLAEDFPIVFASYHPSPRNTNTGKMTSKMFSDVLVEIRKYLAQESD